jgi:hypothetical protein
VSIVNPIHGDHCEAQHREYMIDHDAAYAFDVVAEIVQLETTFSLSLLLMGLTIGEKLHHFSASGNAIDWP